MSIGSEGAEWRVLHSADHHALHAVAWSGLWMCLAWVGAVVLGVSLDSSAAAPVGALIVPVAAGACFLAALRRRLPVAVRVARRGLRVGSSRVVLPWSAVRAMTYSRALPSWPPEISLAIRSANGETSLHFIPGTWLRRAVEANGGDPLQAIMSAIGGADGTPPSRAEVDLAELELWVYSRRISAGVAGASIAAITTAAALVMAGAGLVSTLIGLLVGSFLLAYVLVAARHTGALAGREWAGHNGQQGGGVSEVRCDPRRFRSILLAPALPDGAEIVSLDTTQLHEVEDGPAEYRTRRQGRSRPTAWIRRTPAAS